MKTCLRKDIDELALMIKENYVLACLNYYYFEEFTALYSHKHNKEIREIGIFPTLCVKKASELLSKTETLIFDYKIDIPPESVSTDLINQLFDTITVKRSYSMHHLKELEELKIKTVNKTIKYLEIIERTRKKIKLTK